MQAENIQSLLRSILSPAKQTLHYLYKFRVLFFRFIHKCNSIPLDVLSKAASVLLLICTISTSTRSCVGKSSTADQNTPRFCSGIPYTAISISLLGRLSLRARDPNSTILSAPCFCPAAAIYRYISCIGSSSYSFL